MLGRWLPSNRFDKLYRFQDPAPIETRLLYKPIGYEITPDVQLEDQYIFIKVR